jgi:hypothetical protein
MPIPLQANIAPLGLKDRLLPLLSPKSNKARKKLEIRNYQLPGQKLV